MMPCNNYYMVYTYSFLTFYVKHEYVRLVKANVGNDKIRLL